MFKEDEQKAQLLKEKYSNLIIKDEKEEDIILFSDFSMVLAEDSENVEGECEAKIFQAVE